MHRYQKGEYREQFVIAYITDFDSYEDTVLWAEKFCDFLHKGLILLHISDKKYTDISSSDAEKNLKTINNSLQIDYFHSYAALSGNTKEIIHDLGDLLNGVMIISKVEDKVNNSNPLSVNNIIKNFYSSRLAYFVFKTFIKDNDFKNIVLSMNAMKECKEKILWASYFGRFNGATTHIFYRRYKDEFLQKQLNLNIGFLRRMFRKFDIPTLNAHCLDRKTKLDVQALDYAKKNNCNLCIFQTTKNKSYIEFFTGLPERMALKKMENIPILFLNQREDLFVMCE